MFIDQSLKQFGSMILDFCVCIFFRRWRSRRQSQRNQTPRLPHLSDTMILGLHLVVNLGTLMVNLVVADLELVDMAVGALVEAVLFIDQVVPMGAEQAPMEDLVEVTLVVMEDMVEA